METGTVKWFIDRGGYGYIARDDGGPDVFVLFTSIKRDKDGLRTLFKGQRVQFSIIKEGSNRYKAQGVEQIPTDA